MGFLVNPMCLGVGCGCVFDLVERASMVQLDLYVSFLRHTSEQQLRQETRSTFLSLLRWTTIVMDSGDRQGSTLALVLSRRSS